MRSLRRVSVVVVSYNGVNLLRNCLRSVLQIGPPLSLEVLVVDNGSTDGSPEMVSREFPEVRTVRSSQNLGYAAAINTGIRAGHGEYFLLLNSDAEVLPGALEAMVRAMEARPSVGLVGCRLLNVDRSLQPSQRTFPTLLVNAVEIAELYRLLPTNRLLGRLYPYRSDHRSAACVDWVSGACLLVRRAAIEQVGQMDEGYFFYGEEMDWCYRMRLAGWGTLFTADGEVIHHGGGSSGGSRATLIVQQYRSLYRFYKVHYPNSALVALKALVFAMSLPKVILLALLERGNPQRRDLRHAYWAVACLGFRE